MTNTATSTRISGAWQAVLFAAVIIYIAGMFFLGHVVQDFTPNMMVATVFAGMLILTTGGALLIRAAAHSSRNRTSE